MLIGGALLDNLDSGSRTWGLAINDEQLTRLVEANRLLIPLECLVAFQPVGTRVEVPTGSIPETRVDLYVLDATASVFVNLRTVKHALGNRPRAVAIRTRLPASLDNGCNVRL